MRTCLCGLGGVGCWVAAPQEREGSREASGKPQQCQRWEDVMLIFQGRVEKLQQHEVAFRGGGCLLHWGGGCWYSLFRSA